jgi:hypothetical protein
MAEQSQQKQREIESRAQLPFDQFLSQYFAQCYSTDDKTN